MVFALVGNQNCGKTTLFNGTLIIKVFIIIDN